MTKVLVTGARGMLGRTLLREQEGAFEVFPTDLPEADITDENSIDSAIAKCRPGAVVHCAAMTAVDKCETERGLAFKINALGTANVASACDRRGARLIAISTDYVFDGKSDRPYSEFDRATGGDISWLYGKGGPSFVHAMMNLADGARPVLKVVGDQRGNPTSATAESKEIRVLLERPNLRGVIHMTCEGEATWAEFAEEIFRLVGRDQVVERCTTEEFPRPAPRPKNSRLEKMAIRLAGLPRMPHWKDALTVFMKEEFGCRARA